MIGPVAASCGFGRGPELELLGPSVKFLKLGLCETVSAFKQRFDPHQGSDPFFGFDVRLKLILRYIVEACIRASLPLCKF